MKRSLIILVAIFSMVSVLRAEIPKRPSPARLVNDFANVLSENERGQLENALVQFARETSTQIVVVTVPDLEGDDPADYSFKLGEKWGIGQKDKDNGIVVLLKPKAGNSKGQVFIATGYGLEGVLPDAIVNSAIVDNEMIPRFKQGEYFEGLVSGIKVMMDITQGEYTAENYRESVGGEGSAVPFFIFLVVIAISIFGRGRHRRFYSPGRSLPFWLAMGMMSGGRSHGGSFNNFSSGGGSFGGGFGGFGGGSFGGGGAGGSW